MTAAHPPDESAGHRRSIAELVEVGAQAVRSGLVLASGGNLSVRGPGPDRFTVTARGSYLDALGPDTLTVMTMGGDVVSGPEPSSEWRLHQQTYLARPDADAIVHVHPEYAVLVDAIGEPIRQLTLDHVAYVPRIARIPFYPNGSVELGRQAARAVRDCDCVVLAHHGCSTVGGTPLQALRRAVNLESAARATYRLLVLGDRTTEFPAALRATASGGAAGSDRPRRTAAGGAPPRYGGRRSAGVAAGARWSMMGGSWSSSCCWCRCW